MKTPLSNNELQLIESVLYLKKASKDYKGENQELIRQVHKKVQDFLTTCKEGFLTTEQLPLKLWKSKFSNRYIQETKSGGAIAYIKTENTGRILDVIEFESPEKAIKNLANWRGEFVEL